MTSVRKPKPRKVITTLHELVLDLEQRLEDGDAAADVWLPSAEWKDLVTSARHEQALHERGGRPLNFSKPSNGSNPPAFPESSPTAQTLSVAEAVLAERNRAELARVLECGQDSSWADLFEVARGYVLALHAELEAEYRARHPAPEEACGALLVEDDQEEPMVACERPQGHDGNHRGTFGSKTIAAPREEEEPEYPDCPHCGEADGHAPGDCAARAPPEALPEELIEDSLRRLRGSAWKRAAKKAREEGALDTCHHCGIDDERAGVDLVVSRNDAVLPDGVFCAGCRELLNHTPEDFERRHGPPMVKSLERADAEERQAKAEKKKRGTKKFPKGDGLTEKCATCGAERGTHDGQKCPPKQHRMQIHDEPTSEAPF